ncbi:MAG: MarR family transcriptional regulator [Actinomycetaceae bacterium]|nr:MarR family transcriptional regulator [Actinomycetaceae bacterium]
MHEQSLALSLTITASRFSRGAVLAAHNDVSSVTWRVASMLDSLGPMRPSQIAYREHTSRATTTKLLRRLESEGLIQRVNDPSDARAYKVELTKDGHRHLTQWRQRLAHTLEPLVDSLPDKAKHTLKEAETIMHTLIQHMEGDHIHP